jgi:site-specific DNA recombinase
MGREHFASGDARKLVGIWIRVSTEDQARGESPAVHEKRARLYAEAKGWNVREVYDLAGVSGKAVRDHPEAQRMLKDMKTGRITGLIFSKLARLARNTKELLEFSEEFREHGADLISLEESVDTSSPAGRLFYTLIAAMAQWEREEIASRVAASVPIRAKMGKPLGGKPPFGYQRVDGKVVPHPTEAPIRKLMYELYIEHRRKKSVARLLNERGFRTSNGSKFTNTTVNRLIGDTTARGEFRTNYTRAHHSRRGFVEQKPESEWVIQEVEPIVSEETWARANDIRERAKKKPNARKPVHLFAGFVFCHCGQKMYVPSRKTSYVCWTCKNRIPVDDLEAIYHEQLKGFLLSDAQVRTQLDRLDEQLSQQATRIADIERERGRVTAEMDKTYRLYLDDGITPEGFAVRYKPLEERLKQLESQLPAERAAEDILKIHRLSSAEILAEARDLHCRWPTLSRDEKRAIIEAITDRITIGKDEITIELQYVPSLSDVQKFAGGQGGNGGGSSSTSSKSPKNYAAKGTQPFGLVRGRVGGTTTMSNGESRCATARVSLSSSSTINLTSSLSAG